jgi:hypothetical protein
MGGHGILDGGVEIAIPIGMVGGEKDDPLPLVHPKRSIFVPLLSGGASRVSRGVDGGVVMPAI